MLKQLVVFSKELEAAATTLEGPDNLISLTLRISSRPKTVPNVHDKTVCNCLNLSHSELRAIHKFLNQFLNED